MRGLLSAIFLLCIFSPCIYAESFININSEVIRLKTDTNCKKISHGKKSNLCDCCLLKHALMRKRSLRFTVEHCSRIYRCSFRDPDHQSYLNRAKHNLSYMAIIDIDKLPNPPVMPKDGILTSESVANILQKLSEEGHLFLPSDLFTKHDRDHQPLKIKALGDTAKGFFSGQLFSIRYDPYFLGDAFEPGQQSRPLYILKETKKGVSEIRHLYQMATSPLKNEKWPTQNLLLGLTEVKSKTIARISFDDAHFKLKTNGKMRYFSLLQTAPGQSLHAHLEEFGKIASNKELDDDDFQNALLRIKNIFYRVGYAVSELHQKYARGKGKFCAKKTFTHGDMHSENIFYDDITDTVTLIDNETFALSLKRPSSGVNDIVEFYMLHTVHTIAHKVSKQLTTNEEFGIDDLIWHELWQTLITGYLDAFGDLSLEDFVVLHSEFREEFFKGFSQLRILRSLRNFKDQRKLKRFGPSFRRSKIKHRQLNKVFTRTLRHGLIVH